MRAPRRTPTPQQAATSRLPSDIPPTLAPVPPTPPRQRRRTSTIAGRQRTHVQPPRTDSGTPPHSPTALTDTVAGTYGHRPLMQQVSEHTGTERRAPRAQIAWVGRRNTVEVRSSLFAPHAWQLSNRRSSMNSEASRAQGADRMEVDPHGSEQHGRHEAGGPQRPTPVRESDGVDHSERRSGARVVKCRF